jgi:hypothetical protein
LVCGVIGRCHHLRACSVLGHTAIGSGTIFWDTKKIEKSTSSYNKIVMMKNVGNDMLICPVVVRNAKK